MPEINLYNIDQITRDVGKQEIGFSHLFHDLVDHICCDVEYNMKQGMSFEDAYHVVKMKIGDRGLKKIQEDTLYAVDNKYRKMKNLMKISGVTGTIMLGFAAIFKISHWPMAGALITLGAVILSFLFLPSALTVLWKETKNQKKLVLFISAFIAGLAFILGMLFKIQHWPGASAMIFIGLGTGTLLLIPSLLIQLFQSKEKKYKRPIYSVGAIAISFYAIGFWFKIIHWPLATVLMLTGSFLLMIVVFPWFTWVQWKNETNVNSRFIFLIIASMLVILPGAIVNLNVSRKYDEGFFDAIEKQETLINIQKERNARYLALYKDSVTFSRMDSIHLSATELLGIINKVKHNMVAIAEESNGQSNLLLSELSTSKSGQIIPYRDMRAPFHEIPATIMLLPGCKAREILEKSVLRYNEVIRRHTGDVQRQIKDELLKLPEYLPMAETPSFEMGLLPRLNSLSILESAILLIEAEAMKEVSNKSK